jgi:rare lipoprotein A
MGMVTGGKQQARALVGIALTAVALAACASGPARGPRATAAAPAGIKIGKPYQVRGVWYTPRAQPNYDQTGVGSWYGEQFHNRYTANGEVFDMDRASAAHTTLPLPSLVEVTNLDNGRKMVVRVNDRGPFVDGRIIDLSREAARQLGYERQGTARVRVRYVGPGSTTGTAARTWQASAPAPKPPATYAVPAVPEYLPDIRPPGPTVRPATSGGYRIQAAAFSDRWRADQAAAVLSATGQAEVVPLERDGRLLYRVQVAGQGEGRRALDQVAALGYPDARLMPLD